MLHVRRCYAPINCHIIIMLSAVQLVGVSEQLNGFGPGSHPHRHYCTMIVNNLKQKYNVQSWQVTSDQRSAAINQVTLRLLSLLTVT